MVRLSTYWLYFTPFIAIIIIAERQFWSWIGYATKAKEPIDSDIMSMRENGCRRLQINKTERRELQHNLLIDISCLCSCTFRPLLREISLKNGQTGNMPPGNPGAFFFALGALEFGFELFFDAFNANQQIGVDLSILDLDVIRPGDNLKP